MYAYFHIVVQQKPTQRGKVIILQLKNCVTQKIMGISNSNAAAAAKSLQSCPTLCNPIDGSPPGSAVPGIPQARTLEWVAISFSNAWKWKVKMKSLSCVWVLATTWTAAYQAPLSVGFSRQEYGYKLNKQGDNIHLWHTPFPIWNQSVVPCPVLTVASWPAYRFVKRQVRWSHIPITFRIFHSLLWSTQSKALA